MPRPFLFTRASPASVLIVSEGRYIPIDVHAVGMYSPTDEHANCDTLTGLACLICAYCGVAPWQYSQNQSVTGAPQLWQWRLTDFLPLLGVGRVALVRVIGLA